MGAGRAGERDDTVLVRRCPGLRRSVRPVRQRGPLRLVVREPEGHAATGGTEQANPYGLYDVNGNTSDWVQDWYAAYPTGAVTDPTGGSPPQSNSRVNRGGSWDDILRSCRSAYRGVAVPDYRAGSLGFRIAKSQ